MISLTVNHELVRIDAPDETPAALHECNVAAQKRCSGRYGFERNQRAAYAACMFSHG
jgi:hypothetical protein